MAEFEGFPRDLPRFLQDLAANNSKAWFDRNRDRYEGAYLEPAKAFVAAIAPKLKRLSRDIRAEPRVNGAIMRINRDTPLLQGQGALQDGALHPFPGRRGAETKNDPAGLLMVAAGQAGAGGSAPGASRKTASPPGAPRLSIRSRDRRCAAPSSRRRRPGSPISVAPTTRRCSGASTRTTPTLIC